MTALFTSPILRPSEHLDVLQKARGAALLVAAEARPASSAMDLLRLADYVIQGAVLRSGPNPMELFGDPVHADPSAFGSIRRSRIANFGDLDPVHSVNEEDDGLDR